MSWRRALRRSASLADPSRRRCGARLRGRRRRWRRPFRRLTKVAAKSCSGLRRVAAAPRDSRRGAPGPCRGRWWPWCGAWAGRAGRGLRARPCRGWPRCGLQLVGELALLEDGGEDRLAAADEIAEVGELLFDVADLDLVESSGGLLAIARDEGDGAAFVEQLDDRTREARGILRVWAMCRRMAGESCFASVMSLVIVTRAKEEKPLAGEADRVFLWTECAASWKAGNEGRMSA